MKKSTTLNTVPDTNNREKELQELEHQIEKLRSDLPYLLQEENDVLPREGRMSNRAWDYFIESIKTNGYIILKVWIQGEINENAIFVPGVKGQYAFTIVEPGMCNTLLFVSGIGEVDCNVIDGVYNRDYIFTLKILLAPIIVPIDDASIGGFIIEDIEFAGISDDKQSVFLKIPITLNKVK